MSDPAAAVAPLFYLGPVNYFATLLQHPDAVWEQYEHYPKQTYRNRCRIYGANGPLSLSVPAIRSGERTPFKDVRISYAENWRKLHWKSFASAYRASPYFEFYEDDFAPIFERQFDFLYDLNLELFQTVSGWIGVKGDRSATEEYSAQPANGGQDFRSAFPAKGVTEHPQLPEYRQVFGDRYGFQSNLSIIDLVFNLGPETASYLKGLE